MINGKACVVFQYVDSFSQWRWILRIWLLHQNKSKFCEFYWLCDLFQMWTYTCEWMWRHSNEVNVAFWRVVAEFGMMYVEGSVKRPTTHVAHVPKSQSSCFVLHYSVYARVLGWRGSLLFTVYGEVTKESKILTKISAAVAGSPFFLLVSVYMYIKVSMGTEDIFQNQGTKYGYHRQ